MADIIIIGSSSGDPSPDRANASFLFNIDGKRYQFDAGEGFSSSVSRLSIDHSEIGVIFISHGHTDHVTGLFLELQMMHLANRTAPLAIYMPEELVEPVKKLMTAMYIFPERLGFALDICPVRPDPVFRDDYIAVYARANNHFKPYSDTVEAGGYDNKMQSYSYVIKTADKKIIYSGDIGSLSDYADLLDECDLLITEGLHLEFEELFDLAAKSNLGKLVLTHLSSEMYANPGLLKILAQENGLNDLLIAEDGLKIQL